MFRPISLLVLSAALLAACGEEPSGPPTSKIYVRNESSTEANVRVKMWEREFTRVSAGNSTSLEFVNEKKVNAVQVEAKSRNQWDDCWVTMNVGETLVVYDSTERIGCRVE